MKILAAVFMLMTIMISNAFAASSLDKDLTPNQPAPVNLKIVGQEGLMNFTNLLGEISIQWKDGVIQYTDIKLHSPTSGDELNAILGELSFDAEGVKTRIANQEGDSFDLVYTRGDLLIAVTLDTTNARYTRVTLRQLPANSE